MKKMFRYTLFPKFLYCYFKIFGLTPVALKIVSLKKKNVSYFCIFSSSKCSVVYNVFLITTLTTLNLMFVLSFYETGFEGSMKFDRFIGSIEDFLALLTTLSVLTSYTVFSKNLLSIANKINMARELSVTFDNGIGEKFTETRNIILIFFLQWILWLIKWATITNQKKYIVYCFAKYFSDLIDKNTFIQYIIILKYVRRLFEKVNDSLSKIMKDSKTKSCEINFLQIKNNDVTTVTIKKLNFLYKNHLFLSEISSDISDFYSYPLFVNLIHIFISLVVSAYLIVKPLVLGINSLSAIDFMHVLVDWFNSLSMLLIITISAGATVSEVYINVKLIFQYFC